jgi:hypothetical protein
MPSLTLPIVFSTKTLFTGTEKALDAVFPAPSVTWTVAELGPSAVVCPVIRPDELKPMPLGKAPEVMDHVSVPGFPPEDSN